MQNLEDLPDVALSIQQPWAWLIVNGYKPIENRDTLKNYRGPVSIHAGKKMDYDCSRMLSYGKHPVTGQAFQIDKSNQEGKGMGGIVGVAEIVDCVTQSNDEWFVGKYGLVIRNAKPIEFIPCKGALGFFKWKDRIIETGT